MLSTLLQLFLGLLLAKASIHAGCSDHRDCSTCIRNSGLLRQSCRYCPIDKNCYQPGAAFINPCAIPINVVRGETCPAPLPYRRPFSPTDGKMAWGFADAAYGYGGPYLGSIQGNFAVRDRTTISPCDSLGNDCYGYTATSASTGTIVVAFRGSASNRQLAAEVLDSRLINADKPFSCNAGKSGRVFTYFYNAYSLFWPKISSQVRQLLRTNPSYKVLVTGHSLGGAIASLISQQLINAGIVRVGSLTLITFGSPRVGDYKFAACHDRAVPQSYRVVYRRDLVPHLPHCNIPAKGKPCSGGFFYHHGVQIFYENSMQTNSDLHNFKSCYESEDLSCSNKYYENGYDVGDHFRYYGSN